MTSIWPLRLRSLLTLIFLTGLARPPLTDATVHCQTGIFKQGEIITTSQSSQRLYCGSRVGRFLAVKENVLFHLDCPKGSPLGKATAVIINMAAPKTVKQYFDNQQGCDVKAPQGMTTGANAYAVADLFKGGRGEFDARSSINKNAFRFKGKFTEYTWSNSRTRELVPVSEEQKSGGRAPRVADVNKMARGGGGGGRGSGGGRGTRGGGGTEGGSGSGVAGKIPYVAGGAAAGYSASSATRPTPWPFGGLRTLNGNFRNRRSRRN